MAGSSPKLGVGAASGWLYSPGSDPPQIYYARANARDELTAVEVAYTATGASGETRVREEAAYDAAGNFLGAANASLVGASGRHFFHNSENRLLTAVLPGVVYDYVYDPSGRRVFRRVLKAQRGGGAALAFVHAGDMEIADVDAASGAAALCSGGGG